MFARAVAGTPSCLERTRFPITATATSTIGSGALVGCFSNCTPGTPKIIPTSSMGTRRLTDMALCCGSRSTILTRRSSERVGWRRRSLRNRTSTLRPSTEKFGSATPMATLWWSPVRTAKAFPSSLVAARLRRLSKARSSERASLRGAVGRSLERPSFDGRRRRSNPGIERASWLWIASHSLAMTIVARTKPRHPQLRGDAAKPFAIPRVQAPSRVLRHGPASA
jgi:hypothetical protein